MAKPRNELIDRLQFAALRIVAMTMHCWPVHLNLAVARFIGDIMYVIDKKHRDRAMANLKRSFPEKSEKELKHLSRLSMQQLIMLGAETLFTTRLIRLETLNKHIHLDTLGPALRLLLDQKRPVVMITGHYGNWEVLGYALATLGFNTVSVARPLDNPYVNEFLLGVRERKGQRIIAKKGATNVVVEALQNHGAIGFIADQNAGAKGMFVDFFGRKASTYKSIGLLAMQYSAPIVIGFTRRVSDRFEFQIGVQDVIYPEDWSDKPDPLRYITQRYTKGIEDFVRAEPGQYLWIHRRWKSRPKGEEPEAQDVK